MKVDKYGMPVAQGLYDPWYERAACGVGYVVSIDGIRSNKVKQDQTTSRALYTVKSSLLRRKEL